MNRLKKQTRTYILHCLLEGMSQRSCERVFRVSNKTVAKLFEEAGDMAIEYVATLSDLKIKNIQADELHAFIAAKEKNVEDMIVPVPGAGVIWGYLAMCADTKLVFSYHLGDRDIPDATVFAKDVAAKLARKPNDEFVVRPTIVTDGLHAYKEAFDNAVGMYADRGMMIKRYADTDKNGKPTSRGRYLGSDRVAVAGKPDERHIHTAYIERQNGNLRMQNRRYNRRTNAFSKNLLNHERHLALWVMYHNLCWVPRPARPKRDRFGRRPKQWVKREPAAIAAGIETRLWEIEDLLERTDVFVAERDREAAEAEAVAGQSAAKTFVVDADSVQLAPTHWVYRSHVHNSTKVHTSGCSNCRDGQGKKAGAQGSGEWLPFYCIEDATAAAEEMEPDRNSICSMCIGEYRSLGYRPLK